MIPSLQELHQYKLHKHISTATLQNQKRFYFSRTFALVVVCSSLQNRSFSLMSPERIYFTKTSNWAHEVTFTASSTWKENIRNAFIHHLVFHIFRHIWNTLLNRIVRKRYSSHCCLTSVSKKWLCCFQQSGFHKLFSNRVSVSCLAISSATSYYACVLGETFRWDKSLTFQTCFVALEEFQTSCLGCFVSKCCISLEGFINSAIRVFKPLQYVSSWMLTATSQR